MSAKYFTSELHADSNVTASFQTDRVDLREWMMGSFQVKATTSSGVSWTVALQGSNDGLTFVDAACPTAISTSSNFVFSVPHLTSRYYRLNFTATSGTLDTVSASYVVKGLH
jgi:hypothetical protein